MKLGPLALLFIFYLTLGCSSEERLPWPTADKSGDSESVPKEIQGLWEGPCLGIDENSDRSRKFLVRVYADGKLSATETHYNDKACAEAATNDTRLIQGRIRSCEDQQNHSWKVSLVNTDDYRYTGDFLEVEFMLYLKNGSFTFKPLSALMHEVGNKTGQTWSSDDREWTVQHISDLQ